MKMTLDHLLLSLYYLTFALIACKKGASKDAQRIQEKIQNHLQMAFRRKGLELS